MQNDCVIKTRIKVTMQYFINNGEINSSSSSSDSRSKTCRELTYQKPALQIFFNISKPHCRLASPALSCISKQHL